MDSFFPFDPFKLPLSSIYIDDIYRDWVADDESSTSETSSSDGSEASDDDSSSSDEDEDDDETEVFAGGLAVPGLSVSRNNSNEDDDVARSFEAMSLSLSPEHESFGGRRRAEARFGSIPGMML